MDMCFFNGTSFFVGYELLLINGYESDSGISQCQVHKGSIPNSLQARFDGGWYAKAVDIMTNVSIRCFQNSSTTPRTGGDHTGAPSAWGDWGETTNGSGKNSHEKW